MPFPDATRATFAHSLSLSLGATHVRLRARPRAASQSPSSSPLVSSGSGGLFVFWVSSGTYLKGGAGWRLRLVNDLGERIHWCNLFNFAPQELFLGLKRRDGLGKSESFEGLSGRESEAVYEESGLNISRMMQHFISSCREH